jgi:predicted enzyme related to lactoylglutathione lyase
MRMTASCCVALQGPDPDRAYAHYQEVMGLPAQQTEGERELSAPPLRLFCDEGEPAVVFELLVDDLDEARSYLESLGCRARSWGGPGQCNYVEDPFGFLWNLYLEPDLAPAESADPPESAGRYRFSNCFALGIPDRERAVRFYEEVMGFTAAQGNAEWTELRAGPLRLFVVGDDDQGPVGAVDVPDREAARRELEAAGCTVVRWEPEKACCFMRNPFGFVFDVYENPRAFR